MHVNATPPATSGKNRYLSVKIPSDNPLDGLSFTFKIVDFQHLVPLGTYKSDRTCPDVGNLLASCYCLLGGLTDAVEWTDADGETE